MRNLKIDWYKIDIDFLVDQFLIEIKIESWCNKNSSIIFIKKVIFIRLKNYQY